MDNKTSERECVIMPLNLPIFIDKDGSVSTPVKLSVSTKQIDENPKIAVTLKPGYEFLPVAEFETSDNGKDKKKAKKGGCCQPQTSDNRLNEENTRVLRVSWEFEQKDAPLQEKSDCSDDLPCVVTCDEPCKELKESLESEIAPDTIPSEETTTNEEIGPVEDNLMTRIIPLKPEEPTKPLSRQSSSEEVQPSEKVQPSTESILQEKLKEQPSSEKLLSENKKYALNLTPPLHIEVQNESIICTKKPEGVVEDGDDTIWINSYYDSEMDDLRSKLTQIEKDVKDFDSTVFRKIDMQASYMFEDQTEEKTNIKWNLQRQLEIVLIDRDIKIDRQM